MRVAYRPIGVAILRIVLIFEQLVESDGNLTNLEKSLAKGVDVQ